MSLYQSINELPLSNFITCLVDNNLLALCKNGSIPTQEQLNEVWVDILQEYTDNIGNNESKMSLSIYKQLIVLDSKLKIVHACIAVLEGDYEESIATMLNEICNTKYNFQGETKIKELKSCLNRSKSIKIAFDLKMMEFEGLREKQNNEEKPSRKHFTSVLIFLSNHAKYNIPDSVTVLEYCERVKQYNYYCQQVKPATNGRR
ncbi:MAG: hypothetical protein KBD43_07265 [Saprospiraceae bacterium]|nr:hypothetical protein [Saprospiraceae bacterium]